MHRGKGRRHCWWIIGKNQRQARDGDKAQIGRRRRTRRQQSKLKIKLRVPSIRNVQGPAKFAPSNSACSPCDIEFAQDRVKLLLLAGHTVDLRTSSKPSQVVHTTGPVLDVFMQYINRSDFYHRNALCTLLMM